VPCGTRSFWGRCWGLYQSRLLLEGIAVADEPNAWEAIEKPVIEPPGLFSLTEPVPASGAYAEALH
jgi:hypothetical protein